MLDFERLDGFVIDLTTDDLCDEIIAYIAEDDVEYLYYTNCDLQSKRDFIIKHYTDNYSYVFCRSLYVYQICENDLIVGD